MIHNYYWVFDKAVPDYICDEILANAAWEDIKDGMVVGAEGEFIKNDKLRKSDIFWLPSVSPIGCIAQTYIRKANREAGWNFEVYETENVQISKYKDQGHYSWHVDGTAPNQYGYQRKLSVAILLNDPEEFEGGVFEFMGLNGNQPKLQQGSVLVFPAFLEHRVTPVTSGTRYSAVTWMYGPSFK